jgi:hypothetical protein
MMSFRTPGILLFLSLLCFSCTQTKTNETCKLPAGKFVNMTVLSGCPGKMPSDIPHFVLEIKLNGRDTAMLDNGFEKFALPVTPTENHCEFKITGATRFGDMLLKVTSDSTFELIDTAWTKLGSSSSFAKFSQGEMASWGFEEFLNDCLVTGEYTMFKHGELVVGIVTFLVNGQINGMKPYLGYELCYAGDCLEETFPPSRTINLTDDQGNMETFALKNIDGKIALELYSVGPPIPDIKGQRSVGPMIYELRTE